MNNYVYVELPYIRKHCSRYALYAAYSGALSVMYKTPVERYIEDVLIPQIKEPHWTYLGVLPAPYDSSDDYAGKPHVAFTDADGSYQPHDISSIHKLPTSVLDDWIQKHSITL